MLTTAVEVWPFQLLQQNNKTAHFIQCMYIQCIGTRPAKHATSTKQVCKKVSKRFVNYT